MKDIDDVTVVRFKDKRMQEILFNIVLSTVAYIRE